MESLHESLRRSRTRGEARVLDVTEVEEGEAKQVLVDRGEGTQGR